MIPELKKNNKFQKLLHLGNSIYRGYFVELFSHSLSYYIIHNFLLNVKVIKKENLHAFNYVCIYLYGTLIKNVSFNLICKVLIIFMFKKFFKFKLL